MSDQTQAVQTAPRPAEGGVVHGLELREIPIADIIIPPDRHVRRRRERRGELASSIAEIGMDQPISVSPADEDGKYVLVIGGGRLESAIEAGWETVPALVKPRDAKARAASAAAENLVRENLSPAEEADAIEAMLNAGHGKAAAFKKIGLTAKRGARRMPLVRLPEPIRSAFDHGGLPPSLAEAVAELYEIHPPIAEAIAAAAAKDPKAVARMLNNGLDWALRELPGLHARLGAEGPRPFAVGVSRHEYDREISWYGPEHPDSIALEGDAGEWFIERWLGAEHEYQRPDFQLEEGDVDAAVAAGVAWAEKGEEAYVYILDREWLTRQVNDVVLPRMKAEFDAREPERNDVLDGDESAGSTEQVADVDGVTVGMIKQKLERAFMRDLKPEAHSANLDLGNALLSKLASVKLTKDTALFFAYEALGRPGSGHGSWDKGPLSIAACAARVFTDWITVERKELKSGRIKETVHYLSDWEAEERMWEFIKGARTPEEILGRTLVMFAAAAQFLRECGANGSTPQIQTPANPIAAEALKRLTGPVIPPAIGRVKQKHARFDATKAAEKEHRRRYIEAAQHEREAELDDDAAAETATLAAIAEAGEVGVTVAQLALALGIGKERTEQILETLATAEKVRSRGRRWHADSPGVAAASDSGAGEKLAA